MLTGGGHRPWRRRYLVAALQIALFVLTSCGYHVVGEKGIFGGEVTALRVPVFGNRSYEPQAPEFFTQAFTRELVQSGLFAVNTPDADSSLQGTIMSTRILNSSLNKDGIVVEKRIYSTVELSLSKASRGFVKRWTLNDSEPYRADVTNLEDFSRRQALQRIAARMARRFTALAMADY